MKRMRNAAITAVLPGAAVGLAPPASADLVDGTYDMVRTDGQPKDDLQMVVASCGAACKRTTVHGGNPRDYHLEGNTWTCMYGDGLMSSIDNESLIFRDGSERFVFMTRQLVKVN